MKCIICGAGIQDGAVFCTSCGAPVSSGNSKVDIDRTVLVEQPQDLSTPEPSVAPALQFNTQSQPNQFMGQPQINQFTGQPQTNQFTGQPQANQFTGQPQINQFTGQPQTNQFTGQPQTNQFTGQPQTNQFTGQPQTNQFTGQPQTNQFTGQPQANQFTGQPQTNQFTGQPQANQFTGQQINYTGQPQGMYGQQPNMGHPQSMYGQGQFNQQPKPPRKPLSKKAKTGIIVGSIVAVLAIIFFVVVLPILTRSKLKGEYVYKDSYATGVGMSIVFDDGTYVLYTIYGDDMEIEEAGTYTFKDNKIVMIDINGKETKGTFDSKNNTIEISYYKLEASDKNATTEIKLTDDYLDLLQERTTTAAENAAANNELSSYYFICDNDLANPEDEFEKDFAEEIGYSNDETLKELIESGYLIIEIYFDSNNKASVALYAF